MGLRRVIGDRLASPGMRRRGVLTALLLLGGGIVAARPGASPAAGVAPISAFPVVGPCSYVDTYGAPRSGGRRHEGVDIIAREGTPLVAVVNGTIGKIVYDRPGSLGGNYLRVTAADGTYYTYIHLSRFAPGLFVGQRVNVGQVIGFVGRTGAAAGPHLHFEVHPGGGPAVNPTAVVDAAGGCSGSGGGPAPTPKPGGVTRFDPALTVYRSSSPLAARVAFGVPVLGAKGVPSQATSAEVKITLTGSAAGKAAVWPCGTQAGLAKGTPLTPTDGRKATSTRLTIRPGVRGRICVIAESRVSVVVEVFAVS